MIVMSSRPVSAGIAGPTGVKDARPAQRGALAFQNRGGWMRNSSATTRSSSPDCVINGGRRPERYPYQPAGYYGRIQCPDVTTTPEKDERQYRRGISRGGSGLMHPMLANFRTPRRGRLHGPSGCVEHAASSDDAVNSPISSRQPGPPRTRGENFLLADETANDRRVSWLSRRTWPRKPTAEERRRCSILARKTGLFRAHQESRTNC